MNRIDQIFERLRRDNGRALMPYMTAGDPDIATTGEVLKVMEAAGASVCELGFPFSDPIADGPVIQESMKHALDRGLKLEQVFEMVSKVRGQLGLGLVAMVSYSIVHRVGLQAFVRDARQAGFDGFIFPDLPVQEAAKATEAARKAGLICSMLVAPTTPIERVERIVKASSGFVYLLSRAGITGERESLPAELPRRIERIRGVTELPIAVGFGIAKDAQVRQVVQVADAAIVGSAIMRRIAEHRTEAPQQIAGRIRQFVSELAGGLNE